MKINTLWRGLPRAARIYLSAVGAVAVAGLAVVVTAAASGTPLLAASPSPSPSASPGKNGGQAVCDRFTGHVASNLGKTQDQVRKAISDAIGQTLDDAVKSGDLTQKQADAIKSRLGSSPVCAGLGRLGHGPNPGSGARAAGVGMAEIAKALGISETELQQDLRSGKSVKDIAASKGMDEAAFRDKLASVVKADLDKQVAAGNVTQKQEDAVLQRIRDGALPLWDAPKRAARPAPPRPSPSATSSAKTGS